MEDPNPHRQGPPKMSALIIDGPQRSTFPGRHLDPEGRSGVDLDAPRQKTLEASRYQAWSVIDDI